MLRSWRATRNAPSIFAACALAAGCATQPPAASIPPPPLQLLSLGNLELPAGCDYRPGVMYRTSYVVQRDGRVSDVQPPAEAPCLQAAFTRWVDSFRYAAPGEPVATVIDWMGVPGRRLP